MLYFRYYEQVNPLNVLQNMISLNSFDIYYGIVCFIPSVHFSDFLYVNNRLWFEMHGNR